MRRVLALAAMAAAFIPAAGCGDASGPSGNSGGDNTTEVCAAVETSTRGAMTKMAPEIAKAVEAAIANDSAAGAAAVQRVMPIVEAWTTSLRAEASKATDVELKSALTAMVSELDRMIPVMATANGIDGLPDMETAEFVNATKKIEDVCHFKFDAITPS
jgi:hypothetical protein